MKLSVALFALPLLAACGDTQHAAYLIDGGQHSLTVTREQDLIGGDWETSLVVARFPDCQRRHPMKGLSGDRVKIDLYRTEPGVFILNAGKRWFVTETRTCRFEQFKEPPPAPGDLIGVFQLRDGVLDYKSQEKPAAATTAAR